MSEETDGPSAEQLTIWRNLLDAFGQLQAAWQVAVRAQHNAAPGRGPGTVHMPAPMVAGFADAGQQTAAILEGLAQVLREQPEQAGFDAVARAGGEARRQWQAVRDGMAPEPSGKASETGD